MNSIDPYGEQHSPLSPSPLTLNAACGGDMACAGNMAEKSTIGPEGTAAIAAGAACVAGGCAAVAAAANTPIGKQMIQGAVYGAAYDFSRQVGSGGESYDAGQTTRAAIAGAIAGPVVGNVPGLRDKAVTATILGTASGPFVDGSDAFLGPDDIATGLIDQLPFFAGVFVEFHRGNMDAATADSPPSVEPVDRRTRVGGRYH